ncbi:MAG TPA: VOC family protein [Candidatus Aquilonibacter sp.]|nr:VOC family protein [Candidatus Aquilonibacter sp.]
MPNVKAIPDGYQHLQAYLIIKNCAEAIEFYKKIFSAKERLRMPRPDGRIGHAELEFGDSCLMMADEHPEIGAYAPQHYGGCPVRMHLYVEDCDAVYKRAIAAGAKSEREPKDQFYGDRIAAVIDPFGYAWYMATHIKDVSKGELEKVR